MIRFWHRWFTVFILLFLLLQPLFSQNSSEKLKRASQIAFTPHNISLLPADKISLMRDTVAVDTMICRNCHPPHVRKGKEPRWDRNLPVTPFPYKKKTPLEKGKVHPLDHYSRKCLSCHDGVIAGFFPRRKNSDLHRVNLGISDDLFSTNLYTHLFIFKNNNPEIISPFKQDFPLSVDSTGYIRCGTCHNPHNNENGKFLRITRDSSRICLVCHAPRNWQRSMHGNPSNPLFYELKSWACMQCHQIHTLPAHPKLLRQDETTLCLSCHDASKDSPWEIPARHNLAEEFEKPYNHTIYINPVSGVSGVGRGQKPWSGSAFRERSVLCSDCHNPHSADEAEKIGFISGSLFNVKGVTREGNPVSSADFEYEICYKCHGSNKNIPPGSPIVSLEFSSMNASYHPVEAPGRNPNVPSLKPGLSEFQMITCSDCHGNDNPLGVPGVHGSVYPGLLKHNFESYYLSSGGDQNDAALCYECHERNVVLGNQGFRWHRLHIQRGGFSCAACHSPHGSRDYPGLLSFHPDLVNITADQISIVSTEPGHGSCSLTCHNHKHQNASY